MTDHLHIVDGEVDTAEIAEYERSRREALRHGFGLGAKVVAAASIPFLLSTRNAFAAADDDATIIGSAHRFEQLAALAYKTAASTGILKGSVLTTVKLIGRQEQQHADALGQALKQMGVSVGSDPTDPAVVESALPGLMEVKTAADIANYAISLEEMAVAAYYEAHGKLQSADLLETGAQIMANEGQHLTVLRTLVNQDPVPNAFEVGKA